MSWAIVALLVGVVTSAISGGSFFAFSNFVMPALSKLPAADGAAAMQAINRDAPNPTFVATLFMPILAGLPVVIAERGDVGAQHTWLALAAVLLGTASLAITMAGNVPLNNHLESLDAGDVATASFWSTYLVRWTRLNTVRGVASIASAGAYAAALIGR